MFPKTGMAQVSARQFDAHYRRLGLFPGATVEEVEEALRALRLKLQPDRLNSGPLKDIAPFRRQEIAESARLITDYWQLHNAAPPSIFGRYQAQLAARNNQANIDETSPLLEFADKDAPVCEPAMSLTVASKALPALTQSDESEIRKAELVETSQLLGPSEPGFNFSYFLFKHVDGAVSPHADVLKPRSILGLLLLGLIWVCIPPFLIWLLASILQHYGIENWLHYFFILAQILPICFAPPLVMYEYAFFRQLRFPFAGALRLPFDQAIDECIARLSLSTTITPSVWTIDSKRIEIDEKGERRCAISASYSGKPGESRLPLKMHLIIEPLHEGSSFISYWFELDWQVLFKGRAVSRMRWARFELDRLIKET